MTTQTRTHTRTAAGTIEAGRVYRIDYRCTTPGPEVEEGSLLGYWNGAIDTWGKLTIQPVGGDRPHYLFAREFTSVSEDLD